MDKNCYLYRLKVSCALFENWWNIWSAFELIELAPTSPHPSENGKACNWRERYFYVLIDINSFYIRINKLSYNIYFNIFLMLWLFNCIKLVFTLFEIFYVHTKMKNIVPRGASIIKSEIIMNNGCTNAFPI